MEEDWVPTVWRFGDDSKGSSEYKAKEAQIEMQRRLITVILCIIIHIDVVIKLIVFSYENVGRILST